MLVLTARFNEEIEIEYQGKKVRFFLKTSTNKNQVKVNIFGDPEINIRRIKTEDNLKPFEKE